ERRSLRFLRVILFWRVLACIDWGCAWGRRNRVWRALRMIGILLLAWLRWRRRRGCAGRDHLVKHLFDASRRDGPQASFGKTKNNQRVVGRRRHHTLAGIAGDQIQGNGIARLGNGNGRHANRIGDLESLSSVRRGNRAENALW